jgi:hypothetical protein
METSDRIALLIMCKAAELVPGDKYPLDFLLFKGVHGFPASTLAIPARIAGNPPQ